MTQTDTDQQGMSPRVSMAVFGAANLDMSAWPSTALTPGDSTPGYITTSAGGVARNVAENLARLGHSVSLVSAVGSDMHGQFVLDHTQRAGVDVSTCTRFSCCATGCYSSLNHPNGSLLAAINDMAVLDLLTPSCIAPHAARLCTAAAWVMDCNLNEACIEWVIRCSAGKPVFADGVSSHKCLKLSPHLAQVHTLKINQLEAQALVGLPVESVAQATAAAQRLCQLGAENVVLSMGSAGVCWSAGGRHGHAAAIQVDVVTSNGAGDALMAGLVHGSCMGWPLGQSVRFASACAALTVLSASANDPDLSEASALRLLAEHSAG